MFPLYKDRDFGSYISDTIDFFKKYGKHYFKNYFIVNGGFLMVLVVLMYFFSKIYMEFFQTNMTLGGQNSNYVNEYFNNNIVLYTGSFFVMMILIMIISVINYALPTLYIELFEEKGTNFESAELFNALKQNIGRILLFFLASLFVVIPIFFIVFAINIALCFILIGIPLLFILFPAFMLWISLSFNDYILGKNNYFTSLSNGFAMLKNNFWPAVGASMVMFIIIYILQTIITMIPYMIGLFSMFGSGQNLNDPATSSDVFSTFAIMMVLVMVLSTLFGYLLQNFLNMQQVFVYYSQLEGSNQNSITHEIESIGAEIE
jgi:hypothetical protein